MHLLYNCADSFVSMIYKMYVYLLEVEVGGLVVKLLQQFQRKFKYILLIHKLSSKVGVCRKLIIPSMCSMHDQTSSVDAIAVP